ncbi:MAG: DUF975 family protein [Bacteroidales bacterium]|nr:DUF975 family protein [Bacteroidales bacterium]MBR1782493.1 DUF975 family protein [Bacteroidales bacterium]
MAIVGPMGYASIMMQDTMAPTSFSSLSDAMEMAQDPEFMAAQKTANGVSSLTFLLEIFLLLPLEVAFLNIFRKLLVNGDNNMVGNLFNFSNYWKKIGGMLLVGILTFLWSLLFIIPGIIKAFSYSMTPYILDENPELGASEAIHRSRMMMKNHKFDLFWLYLSFIGWFLLCCITCGIGFLWLAPYMDTAKAAFYEEVKADYALNGGLD